MAEFMKTETVNILEFVENAFTQEVDIALNGTSANKYLWKLCDFVNTSKGGMKKHIRATHRNAGIKRSELDDTNEISDEKKAKTDEFEPNVTSTQKPQKAKMNLTVSALTNDFLRNLLENNEAFNEDGKTGSSR